MGLPGFVGNYLFKSVKRAIIKHGHIGKVYSVSIDLNGLLHKAFSLIYMISVMDKSKELMKIGTRLVKEGNKNKDQSMIDEGNELLEESKLLQKQYEEGQKLVEQGEKLLAQGRQDQYKVRDGENLMNEKFYMRRKGLSEDLVEKYESDYHQKVWELIKKVLEEFGDVQLLILAVDGVSPLAKLFQQKQRRSKAAVNNRADINYDSNVLTPGTEFMIRLDLYLKNQIIIDRKNLPEKVIYSNHMIPGEGEHKIFQYMREGIIKSNDINIVLGLDADLIMLSLLSPQKNIILSRELQEDMINIGAFKQYLIDTLKTKSAIQDFVIMIYLLGNDFIRHSPSLEVSAETIDMMINVYLKGKYNFVEFDDVNIDSFNQFINQLSNEEPLLLETLSRRSDYFSTPLETAKLHEFDLNVYREAYYEKEFGAKYKSNIPALNDLYVVDDGKIEKMVYDYMKTICWNYLYYTKGTSAINSQWIYKYNYAPMLSDLAIYGDIKPKHYQSFKGMIQFNPLQQLVSVLPQKSIDIVPDELKVLFDINSPIYDLFPTTFINDKEGKIMKKLPGKPLIDYGVAIIPLIDQRRIIDVISTIKFSEERLKLWDLQKEIVSIDFHPFKGKPQFQAQSFQPYQSRPQPKYEYKNYQTYQQPYQSAQFYQSYQTNKQSYQYQSQYPSYQSQSYQYQSQPYQQQYTPYQPQPKTFYQPSKPKYVEIKVETPIKINGPPMLNLDLLQHYIKTGKTEKKTAKETLFEEDWD